MKFSKGNVNAVFGLIVLGTVLMVAPYIMDATSTAIPSAGSHNATWGNTIYLVQQNASANTTTGLTMANIAPILSGVGILLAVLGAFLAVTRK